VDDDLSVGVEGTFTIWKNTLSVYAARANTDEAEWWEISDQPDR
jgi:hypothetical protein